MKVLAVITTLIAMLIAILTFIPLLGWLYWIIIPIAGIGYLFAYQSQSGSLKIINMVIIILGVIRLATCGGFV